MQLDVNDAVRHIASGITGSVTELRLKSVLTETEEGFILIPRVLATVRVTTAAYYGQFCDFTIDELAKA
jgi:hypothetical protein